MKHKIIRKWDEMENQRLNNEEDMEIYCNMHQKNMISAKGTTNSHQSLND